MAEASTSKLQAVEIPTKPDRSGYNRIKRKYKALQLKYADVQTDRGTLEKERKAAEAKLAKLNAEINLILDQLEPEFDPGLLTDDVPLKSSSAASSSSQIQSESVQSDQPRAQAVKRSREEGHSGAEREEDAKRPRLIPS